MAVIPSSNGASGGFRENAREFRDEVERGRSELRAVGARARDVTDDLRELARLEAELAKAEFDENRSALKSGAISGSIAGSFAFWILGFLGGAMTFALAEVWPAWLAALTTAGAFLIVAAIAGLVARSRFKQFSPTPRRTIASLREDIEWLRRLTTQNAASASSGR